MWSLFVWYDCGMRVVGCLLEYGDEFVILRRHIDKPQGATWGLPSGKVEAGESDDTAIIRELYEETGFNAQQPELERLGEYHFERDGSMDNLYIIFRVKLTKQHQIRLEDGAHTDFAWITATDCYKRADLILGLHELLRLVGYAQ